MKKGFKVWVSLKDNEDQYMFCIDHGLPGEVPKRPICVVSQNNQGTWKLQWKCRLDRGRSLVTSSVWHKGGGGGGFPLFWVFGESHPQPPVAIGGNGSIEELWPSYASDPSGKLGKLQGPMDILLPWRLGRGDWSKTGRFSFASFISQTNHSIYLKFFFMYSLS